MEKAIFLDKDGVLNEDRKLTGDYKNTVIFPYAGEVIAYLRSRKFKVFIVSNQPVVARGLITEKELRGSFKKFLKELLRQNKDAIVEKIYYCPHHPDATLEKYRQLCDCRKPKPGMLKKAAIEHALDLRKCYMVGDRISDIAAGYLAGCRTVLCMTGKHNEKMIVTDLKVPGIAPDYCISDIRGLKELIK